MVAHGSRIKVKIEAGEWMEAMVAKDFLDQQQSNKAVLISCVSKEVRFWDHVSGPSRCLMEGVNRVINRVYHDIQNEH